MISEMPPEIKAEYITFDYHATGKSSEKSYLLKQKVKKVFDQMGYYLTLNGEIQR